MDIEEFYDADPRRRASDEEDFGTEWQEPGDPDDLWSLHWIKDTGELYRMREPKRTWFLGGRGWQRRIKDKDLGVEVIGHVRHEQELKRILGDWQLIMSQPDGLSTVKARFAADGNGS